MSPRVEAVLQAIDALEFVEGGAIGGDRIQPQRSDRLDLNPVESVEVTPKIDQFEFLRNNNCGNSEALFDAVREWEGWSFDGE